MPAPPRRTNIYDLTARESASMGSQHADLLIEAFKAIVDNKLSATFDESPSTATVLAGTGVTWRAAIRGAISALEREPHFFVGWFRLVFVDQVHYRRLRAEKSEQRVPAQAQRPRPPDRMVQIEMRRYIESEQGQNRKGSQKRAWEWAKNAMPGARYQQVIEALSVAEGGKKQRGRPRSLREKED